METDLDKIHDNKGSDETTTKTVTFINDQGRDSSYDFDRLPLSKQEFSDSDLKDFLGRPVLLGSYNWTTSLVLGSDVFQVWPSDLLLSNTMYVNKLQGFRFMRARVHIKLQIQPTPFQYGALYLAWQPWQKTDSADRDQMHERVISFSQLPGVLYTTEDNSVELSTPYIGPHDAWDRLDITSWDFGSYRCKVYCPLLAGANNPNLSVNVYMWFTDVELTGLIPQSGNAIVSKRTPKNMIPAENEVNEGKGTATKIFMQASQLANTISGVPMFTPAAKPAAWVLASLAKVTSAFGWSKPDVGSGGDNKFVTRNSDAYATNHTGNDAGNYLSAEPAPYVTPHKMLTVRSEDEMSIDFIKQQWSYLGTFSMNDTQVQGTELATFTVCPQFMAEAVTYNTVSGSQAVYTMTPLAYLGNLFLSWRGPVRYRFVLCKTGFHAGQIQISFTPTVSSATFANDQFLPRTIIDIQKGTEFCFDAPYVLNNPFIGTAARSGVVSVKVVNTLARPETVASSIVILVYVRGLEDTQFEKPSTQCPIPCWQPQGNLTEEEGDICSGGVVGNGTQTNPSGLLQQYTMGQKINSVLQLCKLFTPIVGNQLGGYPSPPDPSTTNPTNPRQIAYFDPHYMGGCAITGGPVYGVDSSNIWGDYLSRFAGLYLFHRGGVKIKVKNTSNSNISTFLVGYNTSTSPDWRKDFATNFTNGNIRSTYTSENSSVSHIAVVPQYSEYYGYPKTHFQDGGTIGDRFAGQTILGIVSSGIWQWGEYDGVTIHRAAAEDFSFHMFLGIPSVILGAVTG